MERMKTTTLNIDLPGDKFLPKKGLKVYMLRRKVVLEDLIEPKSKPNSTSSTLCQYTISALPR